MPRVVISPNAFGGSLDAHQAAAALARGFRSRGWDAVEAPVADGGPGTRAVLVGLPVVETAEHAGHHLGRDPLGSDTLEVGRAGLALGSDDILVGMGGSRTTDGGTGFARALGFRFLDREGRDLPRGGGALADLAKVVPAPVPFRVRALTDVWATLLEAATVFAPQKGATAGDVERLRAGLSRLAEVTGRSGDFPGAGAAGGLGYGLAVFAGARIESGIEFVAEIIGLDDTLVGADLCVTGEGSLDSQTLTGKAPLVVAERARFAGVPVAVVAGRLDTEVAGVLGAVASVALADLGPDPMARASEYLEEAARRLSGTVRL